MVTVWALVKVGPAGEALTATVGAAVSMLAVRLKAAEVVTLLAAS